MVCGHYSLLYRNFGGHGTVRMFSALSSVCVSACTRQAALMYLRKRRLGSVGVFCSSFPFTRM